MADTEGRQDRHTNEREGLSPIYFIAPIGFLFIAWIVLAQAGVCVSEARLLKDEDYFGPAIEQIIHDPVDGVMVRTASGGARGLAVHSQKYSNVSAFRKDFPNCCQITPTVAGDGDVNVGAFDWLFGVRVVTVQYSKRYLENGLPQTTPVIGRVAVDHCGKAFPLR